MISYRKILSNTLYLYIRMLVNVVISLYTSRILLEALGVVDYGLYNVIGGIIGLITFFQSTLTNVSMRFFSVGIGNNDEGYLKRLYAFSNYAYTIIFIIVVFVTETIGVWLVNNWVNIPPYRLIAANVIFQCSIFSFAITLFSITSNAAVIAHEDMRAFAYVGLFQSFTRLAVAILLIHYYADRLILYGFLELLIHVLSFLYLTCFAKKHYREFSFRLKKDKEIAKDFLPFVSWNLFGCFTWGVNGQGINLILNKFFDATINAARGFAFQINNMGSMFASNMFAAFRPQIIKSYSNKEWNDYRRLIYKSSNYSFALTWLLAIPIILNIRFLLSFWLKEVPEYTDIFSILTLIFSLINVYNEPIWTGVQASGQLFHYQFYGNLIFLLAFPISYIGLYYGFVAYFPMVVLIIIRLMYIFLIILIVKNELRISLLDYSRNVFFPSGTLIIVVVFISIPFTLLHDSWLKLIFSTFIITLINITLVYLLMLDNKEKKIIYNYVTKMIHI